MTTIKVGDGITVPRDSFCRGGETGYVLEVHEEGVVLDFYRCFCGATQCACYTSIEFWYFKELSPDA